MGKWVDVTESFSEHQRHYRDTYLEICEVLDDTIECSLFSRENGPYEIYVSFGKMYGISYVDAEEAYARRAEMMRRIEEEHEKNGDPSSDFIDSFASDYELNIMNAFFNADAFMDDIMKLWE